MDKGKHGVRGGHFRWCDGCNDFHGYLFVCRYFSEPIRKEIEKDARAFKKLVEKERKKR